MELNAFSGAKTTMLSVERLLEMDRDDDFDADAAARKPRCCVSREGGNQRAAVDRFEFMRYILIESNMVPEDRLTRIEQMFNDLDIDGSGILDADDAKAIESASIAMPTL